MGSIGRIQEPVAEILKHMHELHAGPASFAVFSQDFTG
jgi:hypothetical protein